MTIADLYSHRSGLPDHAGDILEDLGYDRRQVLERLKYLPLAPFRISYEYTNFGVTAAAEAVAAAAGKPWDVTCPTRCCTGPLGMTSTSSRFADFQARANRAVGHVKTPDGYQPLYTRDPDAQSPAGGVSSSINDMARWLTMLLANGTYNGVRIASPEALLPTVTPQVISVPAANPNARASFYGHGFNVSVTSSGRTQYSHSGAFELGAATAFAVVAVRERRADRADQRRADRRARDAGRRSSWISCSTARSGRTGPRCTGRRSPRWTIPRARLSASSRRPTRSGQAAERLRRRVRQPLLGTGESRRGQRRAAAVDRPARRQFPLSHWDGDTFTFTVQSENAPPGTISKAMFNGNALTLEYFDTDKLGTFTR